MTRAVSVACGWPYCPLVLYERGNHDHGPIAFKAVATGLWAAICIEGVDDDVDLRHSSCTSSRRL